MRITIWSHLRSFVRGTLAIAAALAVVLIVAPPAFAVSMSDLVKLANAGLSDDVLVALVEADDTSFNLDGPKILDLRQQGLSERVIMAMLKSGHPPVPPPAQPPDAARPEDPPSLVIIGEQPPSAREEITTPALVVPWIVTVPVGRTRPAPTPAFRGFGRFMNDGWVERPATHPSGRSRH